MISSVALRFSCFRDLLRDKFDLTLFVDEKPPHGAQPLDFMKIFAFSLNLFQKCVYLSTSTMVCRECSNNPDMSYAKTLLH